jgi:UDP-glucose 4-epimerase
MAEKLTILITGGAGFVGSNLCERLVGRGHKVISLDNYFAGSNNCHVEGVEYREGHTKDIEKHVPERPNVIFHLGEYARVEQSMLEPDVVHDLNVLGTQGVIDFWKKHQCKLVYAGSSTKFGDGGKARNVTPYAKSKADNTELVKKVGDEEELPYAITYFYNVYGPRERAGLYGTVIEAFKQMYLTGSPMAVVKPGTQTRNFTHVDDVIDGLLLVGESGHGDGYNLGSEKPFTIIEVANYFDGNTVMLPERKGNRMSSDIDTRKIRELGWAPKRNLKEYIRSFVSQQKKGVFQEKRILVFATTFNPEGGPAEDALEKLIRDIPDVHFDIVTSTFSKTTKVKEEKVLENAHIHRVGFGYRVDKYLLPILGFRKARELTKENRYLFAWSLMASYAAIAGILLRRINKMPLLVTLADQEFDELSVLKRYFLKNILSDADQVYGVHVGQEQEVQKITKKVLTKRSLGDGDAFANQLRYSYTEALFKR